MSADERKDGFDDGDDVLAGEYVLGVLDEDVRRAVEIRVARDDAFARLVTEWEERLSEMNAAYEEVAPPRELYARLDRRLFGGGAAPAPESRSGLWNSLALWRVLTLASLLCAAFLGVVVAGFGPFSRDRQPTLVAELAAEEANVNLLAAYDRRSGLLSFTPVAAATAPGSALELWLIESPGAPPISLGVLPDSGRGGMVLAPEERRRLVDGAILAVSLEPEGGSPTGAPTGPVVASGEARNF